MKYEIPVKLPSCNDYINECRRNKYAGAKMKAKYEQMIGLYLMKMPRWTKPIKIHFTWVEGSKRRDYDNIIFAQKFIFDALVKFGKIKDDSPKYICGLSHDVVYGEENKVILEIEENKDDSNV